VCRLKALPIPKAKRTEIEARLNGLAPPFRTVDATGHDIIHLRETRALVCDFVKDGERVLRTQLGKPSML
jgi:hypothetical protein